MCAGVRGVDAHGLSALFDSFGDGPRSQHREPEVAPELDVRGLERHGLRVVLDGLPGLVPAVQRESEVVAREGVPGIQLHRQAVRLQRLFALAAGVEHESEVGVRGGVLRIDADRFDEMFRWNRFSLLDREVLDLARRMIAAARNRVREPRLE